MNILCRSTSVSFKKGDKTNHEICFNSSNQDGNIWHLHTISSTSKYKQKYKRMDELKRNKTEKFFIFWGRVLVFCQWKAETLNMPWGHPFGSYLSDLWICCGDVGQGSCPMGKISVWDLWLVVWPLQSILFIPSTFCWQRYRRIFDISTHISTCQEPCVGKKMPLAYRQKISSKESRWRAIQGKTKSGTILFHAYWESS